MANPWQEAAESMKGTGITSLGQSFSPRFEPQAIFSTDPNNYGEPWIDSPPENYSTSFRTRDLADRFDYGYGQMMNPQGGARQIGPWLNDGSVLNPNIFEKQIGSSSFPGGARTFAERHNSGDFTNWNNLGDFRNMVDWMSNLGAPVDSSVDQYGYNLSRLPNWDSDKFKSKREQIEEARKSGIYGDYIADLMEMYGRDNPYTQDLGETLPFLQGEPQDSKYSVRSPQEIATGYGQNLGDQYKYFPRQPGIDEFNDPLQYLPSDRQPGIDEFNDPLQYLPSDRQPGIDEFNDKLRIGLTYPEGIGLDRAPEEILAAPEEDESSLWDKVLPFIPPIPGMPWLSPGMAGKALDLFSQDDIYQDPIRDMVGRPQQRLLDPFMKSGQRLLDPFMNMNWYNRGGIASLRR